MKATVSVTKVFTFDAAHYLEDYDGPCARMHGHTYRLEVELGTSDRNLIDETSDDGMVADFGRIKQLVHEQIISVVDHRCLNEVLAYNPTAENMVLDFSDRIREALQAPTENCGIPGHVTLLRVRLWEGPDDYAEWRAATPQASFSETACRTYNKR